VVVLGGSFLIVKPKEKPKTNDIKKTMLPNLKTLARVRATIKNFRNKPGERKGKIHYGVFLLCFGSGLRVSEAISFDYQEKYNGLYKLKSTKGKSERYVAVSDEIVQELKANH
jgi:integrase